MLTQLDGLSCPLRSVEQSLIERFTIAVITVIKPESFGMSWIWDIELAEVRAHDHTSGGCNLHSDSHEFLHRLNIGQDRSRLDMIKTSIRDCCLSGCLRHCYSECHDWFPIVTSYLYRDSCEVTSGSRMEKRKTLVSLTTLLCTMDRNKKLLTLTRQLHCRNHLERHTGYTGVYMIWRMVYR
jgi:hypothetical protein